MQQAAARLDYKRGVKLNHCYHGPSCKWWFDGTSVHRATPPIHVPSLLERESLTPESVLPQIKAAFKKFWNAPANNPREHLERELLSVLSRRNVKK